MGRSYKSMDCIYPSKQLLGEISFWPGLAISETFLESMSAPTPSAAQWTNGSARRQNKMHASTDFALLNYYNYTYTAD
ncbi:hypothetical protein MKX07_001132 [Trichoderma sp. CBMAI-0711]|nr:hypothetical protein MKX07_001132 [Trichoderma sp. CBMAI-0711]